MEDHEDLVAIPRLAERVGLSPRVLRYWEEQGIISPSREHGRLRYGPRDEAIARLARRLMEATGCGVETVRTLKRVAEREVPPGNAEGAAAIETALRLLYVRKAFQERFGVDPEHLVAPPPHGPRGGHHGRPGRGPGSRGSEPPPGPGGAGAA
ncbi:MAG: helix-turn-helix domain-containing protein [Candidatus Dormibacterales bacterium]